MDLQEMGWGDTEWADLPQERDTLWALVNVVMNLRVPQNGGIILTS